MVFGYAAAAAAGFLLTAIPNRTGRMPLQGGPSPCGCRYGPRGGSRCFFSDEIGVNAATVLDLAFPLAFLAVIARETITGRNWRNQPMLGTLALLLLGLDGLVALLPETAALYALTSGRINVRAIGTMTLGVMTRASLGHTARPLTVSAGTTAIYVLITLATVLRVLSPLGGANYPFVLSLAEAAWSGAFTLFVPLYARPLPSPPRRT